MEGNVVAHVLIRLISESLQTISAGDDRKWIFLEFDLVNSVLLEPNFWNIQTLNNYRHTLYSELIIHQT